MDDLQMNKGELVNRARRYAEAALDLEAAERELRIAQSEVKTRQEEEKKASKHLCCTPLHSRTTTVLLDHPSEKDHRLIVTITHSDHSRDGNIWNVQMLEITATEDVESDE